MAKIIHQSGNCLRCVLQNATVSHNPPTLFLPEHSSSLSWVFTSVPAGTLLLSQVWLSQMFPQEHFSRSEQNWKELYPSCTTKHPSSELRIPVPKRTTARKSRRLCPV